MEYLSTRSGITIQDLIKVLVVNSHFIPEKFTNYENYASPSSKKKKKKKKRVPAEGYLMSFPVLAYDAKSTGILFQGGEESDVTRQKQGTKPREAGPQESRAGDRLRPPPVPTSRGSGF